MIIKFGNNSVFKTVTFSIGVKYGCSVLVNLFLVFQYARL